MLELAVHWLDDNHPASVTGLHPSCITKPKSNQEPTDATA